MSFRESRKKEEAVIRRKWYLMATVFLLAAMSGAARADVTLEFTEANNFGANNSDLPATVTFHVSGNTLTITLDNQASAAEISALYFNAATGVTFSNVQATSNVGQSLSVTIGGANGSQGPFGKFAYKLDFGSGQNSRLNADSVATITANFSGTITETDLQKQIVASGGLGSFAGVIDWKPIGANTGFGAGNVGEPPVLTPEPSTVALALSGLGMTGLTALRRRKRSADHAQA